jgi:multidrug efflux pump subunit AcrB
VTAQDVRAALQSSNASQPAGTLVKDNREVLVQTGAYLASAADVKQLVVGVQNGQPVFVTDVARVEDGPDLPTDYVWFGSGAAAGAKASGRASRRDAGHRQEAGPERGRRGGTGDRARRSN